MVILGLMVIRVIRDIRVSGVIIRTLTGRENGIRGLLDQLCVVHARYVVCVCVQNELVYTSSHAHRSALALPFQICDCVTTCQLVNINFKRSPDAISPVIVY